LSPVHFSFVGTKKRRLKNTTPAQYAHSLTIAVVLMIFTMLLHPVGGSIEHLQRISNMIMITHSLAILSIPFCIIGFWGLAKQLNAGSWLSLTAFITLTTGLFAVMLAAAVNGLALPLFLHNYTEVSPEQLNVIKPIVKYNVALNHAFDLIFTGASCLAAILWSLAIIGTKQLPVWLGWAGIAIAALAIAAMTGGFVFTDLTGFRIFMAGFGCWMILIIFVLHTIPAER